MMVDRGFVGQCGIYCGACPIYRGCQGDEQAREFARKVWKTPPERMNCHGCHALAPGEHGTYCPRRTCMEAKGYEYCSECREYSAGSCRKFGEMDEYFNGIGESLREHLRRINAGEADAWLEEQGKKWSCPFCGSPIFWEEKTCPSCGKPLK